MQSGVSVCKEGTNENSDGEIRDAGPREGDCITRRKVRSTVIGFRKMEEANEEERGCNMASVGPGYS